MQHLGLRAPSEPPPMASIISWDPTAEAKPPNLIIALPLLIVGVILAILCGIYFRKRIKRRRQSSSNLTSQRPHTHCKFMSTLLVSTIFTISALAAHTATGRSVEAQLLYIIKRLDLRFIHRRGISHMLNRETNTCLCNARLATDSHAHPPMTQMRQPDPAYFPGIQIQRSRNFLDDEITLVDDSIVD